MNNNSDIVCPLCSCTGVIKYERGFESSINITCTQCDGKMFSELASSFTIGDKTILDFMIVR
ncbi:hypothetical protein LS73_004735 [Helicobacter muridarum]|uniref:Uncharacterized protein n=1 Tax=Helicobacter muridarum TaxID=216 RepID=A0A099U0H8_9HELI|nr:hypothetical protein [Helicobacter muridarum]TLE00491.1 hypothetical protein LS73_004735 [Helicobacter muridarum]STQ86466.1 Uncharacterised protein [Helicobacter muridarum]